MEIRLWSTPDAAKQGQKRYNERKKTNIILPGIELSASISAGSTSVPIAK